MSEIAEEFKYRAELLMNMSCSEADERLTGFYEWITAVPEIADIVAKLEKESGAEELLKSTSHHIPPKAQQPEQIAGVGLLLMREISEGAEAWRLSDKYSIQPSYRTDRLQDYFDEVFNRFVEPAIQHVYRVIQRKTISSDEAMLQRHDHPLEITESLARFREQHPDSRRAAFVMMQFGSTELHGSILAGIRDALGKYGIIALRADDREYHDDLFPNVLTYMHGCGFGIAVFERLCQDDFNPNVSLEVGYMRAISKPICLLKDKTLQTLQTDLVGKLYREFDPQNPVGTIPPQLSKWMTDKGLLE